jgi:hypothetical protein
MVLGSILLVLPAKSYAVPKWINKPVFCGTSKEVIDITKKFREIPLFSFSGMARGTTGQPFPVRIVVAFNDSTKTWSLVEFAVERANEACIIGSGKGINKLLDIKSAI